MKDNGLKRFNNRIAIFLLAIGLCMLAVPAIAEVPTAAFSGTPTNIVELQSVTFSDSSTGVPTSWKWNFGDSCVSTTQNPSHVYNSSGTYTVSLFVENAEGNNTITESSYITVTPPPLAAFTVSHTSILEGETVTFTDQSTNSPTSWAWDFENDGSVDSTDADTTHIYSMPGNKTIKLTVYKGDYSNSSISFIDVLDNAVLPVVTMDTNITEGTAPVVVRFTGNATRSPTSWSWNLGDGTILTGLDYQNVTHTYDNAGIFKVNLTATNAYGNGKSTSTTITVSPGLLPVASFYAIPNSGSAPLTVQFNDSSTNTPYSWHWTFGTIGGTNTSTMQNPSFTYSEAGSYNVTLKVWNSAGNDNETKIDYIYVGTAATTATTATPTPTPTPTAPLPQMTNAFTEATVAATAVPAAAPEGIFAEPHRINSVIEELVKLFKHMLGLK